MGQLRAAPAASDAAIVCADWPAGLRVVPQGERETLIIGPVPDQSALYAILSRLHALNVTLIAVQRLPATRPQR